MSDREVVAMDEAHIDEVYERMAILADELVPVVPHYEAILETDDFPLVEVLLEARDVIAYLREKADDRIVIQCGDDEEPVVLRGEQAETIRQAAIEQYMTKMLADMVEREQARQHQEEKVNAWSEAARKPRDKWWPSFTTDISVNNTTTHWGQ